MFLCNLRQYLSCDATEPLISGFVFSKLDCYCNPSLAGPPKNLRDEFQRVQNAAAWLVVRCRGQHHISLVLYSFHWLPMSCRFQYQDSSLCPSSLFFKAVPGI